MDDLKSVTVRYLRELARKHLGRGHSTLRTREELIAALRKEAPGVLPGSTSAGDADARREAARARRLATGAGRTKAAPARSVDVRTTESPTATRGGGLKKATTRGVKAAVVAAATAVATRAVKAVSRKAAAAAKPAASKSAATKASASKGAAPVREAARTAKRPAAKPAAVRTDPADLPVAAPRAPRTPPLGSPEAAAATRKQGGMSPPRRKPVPPAPVAEASVAVSPRVAQAPSAGSGVDAVEESSRPAPERAPAAEAPKAAASRGAASKPAAVAQPTARAEAVPAADTRPGVRRTEQSAASARIPETPPAQGSERSRAEVSATPTAQQSELPRAETAATPTAQQSERPRADATATPPAHAPARARTEPTAREPEPARPAVSATPAAQEGPRTPPAHVVAFPPGLPRGTSPQRTPTPPPMGASHPPASAVAGAAQGAALAAASATPSAALGAASTPRGGSSGAASTGPSNTERAPGAASPKAATTAGGGAQQPSAPPVEHAHDAFAAPTQPAQTAAEPLVEGFFVARVAGEEEARRHHLVGDGPPEAPDAAGEALGELPWGYGNDTVVLLPRDPGTLHVFWDFSAAARDRALEGLDPVRAVLRVFDGQGLVREEPFALESRSYYLRGLPPGRAYRVEAHFVGRDGRSRRIGPSSGRVALPPAGPSADTSVRFLRVPLPQAARDSVGPPRPQRVTSPMHLVREYLHWRRIPLPGSAGFQDVPERRREEEVLTAPQPEAVPTPAGLPPHLEVRPRAPGSSEQGPAGGPDAGWARPSDSGAGTWSGGSGAGTWSSGSGAGTWSGGSGSGTLGSGSGSGSGGTKGEG